MFKGILCLIIVGASGVLGIFKAQTYSQRVRDLNDLRDMFLMLQTEISYMKDPLPVVFQRIASRKVSLASDILRTCSLFMERNQDIQYCWEAAVDSTAQNSCLTSEDITIIKDIGMQLGRSNIKGQSNLLQMADEKLVLQLREAEAHRGTKGKMYASMGFSIGIVVSILFL